MHALFSLLLAAAPTDGVRPAVGDPAPAFSLPATDGTTVSLADFKGKKTVVLAFFPKAFTGGCTREMTAFRDTHGEFSGAEAQVLGVSMDDLETQKRFQESLTTPFPLLADPKGEAAAAYGVKTERPNGTVVASRVTFVIGKEGTVLKVIEGRDAIDPASALSACKGGK